MRGYGDRTNVVNAFAVDGMQVVEASNVKLERTNVHIEGKMN
jgi:hypothetical protein